MRCRNTSTKAVGADDQGIPKAGGYSWRICHGKREDGACDCQCIVSECHLFRTDLGLPGDAESRDTGFACVRADWREEPESVGETSGKRFGVSRSNAERLMVTELARVQTEAQKQSFIRNGFEEYEYVACSKTDICSVCQALDGKHFKIEDMMPGTNAPPMHPRCHCSVAAYMDDEAYEEWINSYKEHGLNFEDWKRLKNGEKEESKPKYQYPDTVVNKKILKSSQYRRKFENVSEDTKLNRTVWKVSQRMLEHRSGSRYEDLAFIDSITGKSIVNESYDAENRAKPSKAMLKMLKDADHGTIIAIHNHPGSSVPSLADLMVYINRGYQFGLVVCHDGKIYKYFVDKAKFNPVIADTALDKLEIEGYNYDVEKCLRMRV